MKLSLYRMATTLGGPLIRMYLNKRLKRGKEDPLRFEERLGKASLPRPDGQVVWIHAASVGESLSILPLIERVHSDHPSWSVLVTTGTVTSARLMKDRLPKGAMHQYVPADRVSYVRRFLEHWKPNLALWVESEFWPNLVIETRASAVPMVVVNGRMSETSFKGWLKNRAMIKRLLSAFQLVLARDEIDAERFRTLGAKNVDVPGNLKFACGPLPVDDQALKTLQGQMGKRPRWLAASTHAGEEAICGRIHLALKHESPNLLTIIVPRHPERGSAVADELKAIDLNVAHRTAGDPITPETDIYIADTMGELGLFYRLSDIVFIGKTLAGGGGQNPIEPAQLSCALVFGPDMSNFENNANALIVAGGAYEAQDEQHLNTIVKTLLNDTSVCRRTADAALHMAQSEAHVLDRMMNVLSPYFSTGDVQDTHSGGQHART